MEDAKYMVNRDEVYVGKVVKANEISHYNDIDTFCNKSGQLYVSSWKNFRSMLFVVNEENLSNDLLYQSPNYPILNITDDEVCLNLKDSIIIKDVLNLALLLEYFGYKKDLTFEDIIKIRETFFSGKFAADNCQLFGFKETMAEDLSFSADGEKITDPKEIEYRRKMFRISQKRGERSFGSVNQSVLPKKYFNYLDTLGDNDLKTAILWDLKTDAFAPDKQEGPIKKLKRY